MKISHGTTRTTILIGKLAFKVPIMNRSLKHFVKGWLGNVDEKNIWKSYRKGLEYYHFTKLCPIYFSLFGLVNVMPRARIVTGIQFNKTWCLEFYKDCNIHIDVCSEWKNFGYILDNHAHPVMLDYATCRESSEYCFDCDLK